MVRKRFALGAAFVALLVLLWATGGVVASPPAEGPGGGVTMAGTVAESISYQGRLTDSTTGNPLSGNYDMQFQFWDSEIGGSQVGSTIAKSGVPVANGLFNVELEVNQSDFNGQALWLRIGVGGGWLTPRQELLPVPYALGLVPGATIQGETATAMLRVLNEGNSVGPLDIASHGIHATSSVTGTAGVYGSSAAGYGVEGYSTNNIGVFGHSGWWFEYPPRPTGQYGVMGQGTVGVQGEGTEVGVYGVSTESNALGVYGRADLGTGAKGEGYVGVHGIGNSAGVLGEGQTAGVRGTGTFVGVEGDSDGVGVHGISRGGTGTAAGVLGEATATSGTTYGVYGESNSPDGYGGYFEGNVHITGKLTAGAANTSLPIAYAFIKSDGSVAKGTPNVSSVWSATYSRYEITIAGENYFWSNYVTVVTPGGSDPRMVRTGSIGGKLLVVIYNTAGNQVQDPFQFVTYKP